MGAWGVGVFDDDAACDARDTLYDCYRAGQSARKATDAVLEELAEMIEDEEEGPVVILALAAAQWSAGRLDSRIKKRALKIIEQGIDFRWEDSDRREQRRVVLQELAAQLHRPSPPTKPIAELES